ncbi:MAG: type IV pilus modification protein PilV [Gammaproteobacteria bacterium]|nr:type IV pilus modification protein PilV [Gammaproteobacteria bacterium]MBU1440655.1 type IV pilus modification protein PilV [Gammaproteobacteria bacterium]MBU2287144.1 type IV pilus modification protein PilV [Gammaproteobacteria bacterium]MBU2409560.1 type IV pilus modification protein PilV [Gammaproteobacteria bacterium]
MKSRSSSPARRRDQAGVALIEVLVAILIFSLGILGLIGLQARAISFSTDAEDRSRAALLANEIATTMWLNGTLTVPASDFNAWQTRVGTPSQGGLPGGAATITVTGNAADVSITWREPSRSASESDSRLITRVVLP